jgi:photosystem II stability/assembly factor-like uncharacterized protein
MVAALYYRRLTRDINDEKDVRSAFLALIAGCCFSLSTAGFTPAPAKPPTAPQATPVNCEEYKSSFSHGMVLASSGDGLFKATSTGWLRLPLPGRWDQVRVADRNTIYLYDAAGNVIYRSTDAGSSWTQIGVTPFSQSDRAKLYAPPPESGMLFFAVTNTRSLPDKSYRGVWRSVDGGTTWQRTLDLSEGAFPTPWPIAFSPAFAQDGVAFLVISGRGTFVGVWKSSDFGATWAEAVDGMQTPALSGNMPWLAVSPGFAQDQTLFSAGGPGDVGFYKSVDGAATWQYFGDLSPYSLALSPQYPTDSTLAIAEFDGSVFVSRDGGTSLEDVWDNAGAVVVGILEPDDPQTQPLELWVVVQSEQSNVCYLYRSADDGVTWEPQTLYETPYAVFLPFTS